MTKRIFLPIEIQNRELDARLDLARLLLKEDWEVVVGRFNDVVETAQTFGGGVLFYKAHSDFVIQKKLLPTLKSGTRIVCMDEEGLIFPSPDWYMRHRIGTGAYLDHLDAIFTWGPLQHGILEASFPEVAHKLHMTGNQRLRPVPRPDDTKRDIILINTNFGPANLSKMIKETYVEMVEKQRVETSPEDRRFLESRQEYYGQLINHYLSFARDLAAENERRGSPFKIVLRPHPIEDMVFWTEALSDVDVTVETKKQTTDFFPACHCVIHTGCTTALEAFLAGVPVLRYNPIYTKENIQESIIPNAISKDVSDATQVFSFVHEDIDMKQALSNYIYFGDASPNQMQASIIDDLEVEEARPIPALGPASALRESFDVWRCNLFMNENSRSALMRMIGTKRVNSQLAKYQRWPMLSAQSLKRRYGEPIAIDTLASQVFLMRH